jgi:predicted Co/Zn/Cd cation transporter (cation efflux family)
MAGDARNQGTHVDVDSYVRETLKLANKGEDRANSLDMVGWIMALVAVLATVGAVSALLGGGDDLEGSERVAIVLGGLGTVFAFFVVAAVFFGFATLVRNSSRSLELAALDSSLLDAPADLP